ncbi:MAG: hypothetical protein ACI90V_004481 [Bacillariaceae sp.]|jgi:hypothetical protein
MEQIGPRTINKKSNRYRYHGIFVLLTTGNLLFDAFACWLFSLIMGSGAEVPKRRSNSNSSMKK